MGHSVKHGKRHARHRQAVVVADRNVLPTVVTLRGPRHRHLNVRCRTDLCMIRAHCLSNVFETGTLRVQPGEGARRHSHP